MPFINLKSNKRYNIAPTTDVLIIAAQSGLFDSSSTWIGGIVPTDGNYVIIPENITVSIDASTLLAAIAQIQIAGTLEIGYQSQGPFTFSYSLSIIIIPNGRLIDATTGSTNGFSLAFNTAIFCYTGGQYIGKTTSALINAHDSSGNIVSVGSAVSLTGTVNGPWSLLVYTTGLIVFKSGILLFNEFV
jgi:hypothetical protein